MQVTKRDGSQTQVDLDPIVKRIESQSHGLNVDPMRVAKDVVASLHDGVTTRELDEWAVKTSAGLVTTHPDYDNLAARLQALILQEDSPATFSEAVKILHARTDANGNSSPAVSDEVHDVVLKNAARIDAELRHERDFEFDYLGLCTLIQSYLQKCQGRLIERPQYLWMRVSLGIHAVGLGRDLEEHDLEKAFETYHLMSTKHFTHATPTLFNAGTRRAQMSSCFLLALKDDSIEGIYETLTDCARISQMAGGIGLHIHNLRASGSPIAGTGGTSNGIVPMLRNFDATASYVDQGGGKRKGSFAIYLEPWHVDIFSFLDLKRNTGKDEQRARSLFYGLWVPDLFMERVEADGDWTLMDPHTCKGLSDCWGDAFKQRYEEYEKRGMGRETIKARKLWRKICELQVETSMPYMMYKDACNRKSNQQNLGTIKSSNLCTEIVEYTDDKETAVCNLASISLPTFVKNGEVDHQDLHRVVKVVTRNLDRVIDLNYYPTPETQRSNFRHRPIGIGVQGLADVFMKMNLPYGSPRSREINREIFETIYHAAIETSCEMAVEKGMYETFDGSPASRGQLQFDLWHEERSSKGEAVPNRAEEIYCHPSRYNWASMRKKVMSDGLRNSLLLAPMPTASTANVLGNTEGFEPLPSNLYKRNVLSGEFIRLNRHLVKELIGRNLWNDELKNRVVAGEGSIQHLNLPSDVKDVYRTVWELSQRHIIDMAADRGAFVCQSQSMNIYLRDASLAKLTSMHFYGWKKGLKTGSYYIRQTSARQAQKFTLDTQYEKEMDDRKKAEEVLKSKGMNVNPELDDAAIIAEAQQACSLDDPKGCLMCSG